MDATQHAAPHQCNQRCLAATSKNHVTNRTVLQHRGGAEGTQACVGMGWSRRRNTPPLLHFLQLVAVPWKIGVQCFFAELNLELTAADHAVNLLKDEDKALKENT